MVKRNTSKEVINNNSVEGEAQSHTIIDSQNTATEGLVSLLKKDESLTVSSTSQNVKGSRSSYNEESIASKSSSHLKNPVSFWLMVNFASLSNFLIGYNFGLFNTLGDHLQYVYGWTDSEKTLNLTLVNSLPQGVAAIVCLFIGGLSASYGRRKMLIFTAIAALFGCTITLINNTTALILGRMIVGIGFGGWSAIGPMYTIELAPNRFKGLAGILYSVHFGFGILLSFVLGYGLPDDPKDSLNNGYWRLMMALPIPLAAFILVMFLLVYKSETATFIMTRHNDEKQTIDILSKHLTPNIVDEELIDLRSTARDLSASNIGWKQLFGPVYLSRLVLIVIFTLGFNYSGSTAVNIFSFSIIKGSDGTDTAQLFTTIFPIGDILGNFIAAALIQRHGRKTMYIHGLVYCMITIAAFSAAGWMSVNFLQKYLLCLFKLVFASSVAPVHWIYPTEILPPRGVGFFGCAYWICSLSTVQFLPYAVDAIGVEMTMAIFPIATAFVIVFLSYNMKETANKTQQQISDMFRKQDSLLSDV